MNSATNTRYDYSLPLPGPGALAVWRRNVLVWRKLMVPSLLANFGEPLIYLLGLGFGLGLFVGRVSELPYLTFLASGIVVSSAMTTATFEGTYSVYTRMVPQNTYEAILATPLRVEEILAGELLWCANKAIFSGIAILLVAVVLGAVHDWWALLVMPVICLTSLAFAGPALIVTALSPGYEFFLYYFTLVVTPMFMLCGVFYPIDVFPPLLQSLVQVLPLTHAVALSRPLMAGGEVGNVILHVGVLSGYALAGFYGAVVLTRRRLIV